MLFQSEDISVIFNKKDSRLHTSEQFTSANLSESSAIGAHIVVQN